MVRIRTDQKLYERSKGKNYESHTIYRYVQVYKCGFYYYMYYIYFKV